MVALRESTGSGQTVTNTIVERYEYGPYGTVRIYRGSASPGAPEHRTVTGASLKWMDANLPENPVLYAGYFNDSETELDYVICRIYSPRSQQWMQRDPVGSPLEPLLAGRLQYAKFTRRAPRPSAQYDDGMNLHLYVASNPVQWVDPTGLDRWVKYPWYYGHQGLCVDEWAPTTKTVCCDKAQRRCWQKTGRKICFDFSTYKESWVGWLTWPLDVVAGPGTVTESIHAGEPLRNQNPTGCAADRAFLAEMRRQEGDPPLYNVSYFNCNEWTSWYYNYGADNVPRPHCPCDTCDGDGSGPPPLSFPTPPPDAPFF